LNCANGLVSNVLGGGCNIANGDYSNVVGGFKNTSSGRYSFVGGGNNNTASGCRSSVMGGDNNTVSGNPAFIGGGFNNSATAPYASIMGGGNNTASSNNAFIGAGFCNNVTDFSSMVGSGCQSTASGRYSAVMGGAENVASGCYSSVTGGFRTNTYLYGQQGQASGFFATTGDAQATNLTARRSASLSSGGSTKLSLDGTGTTNLLIPNGDNRVWGVEVNVVVVATIAGGTVVLGDSLQGKYVLLFKRIGGVSSVVGVNTANLTYDASLTTANFSFSAGASGDLAITFNAPTTASSTTFRIVAQITLSEVAY